MGQRGGPLSRFDRWSERHPLLALALLALVLFLIGYGMYELTLAEKRAYRYPGQMVP